MAANILRMKYADTIKFLELYQNEPVLWDITRKDYKNRDSRRVAAKRIAFAMKINGFTDVHVITKFKNLRSSYLQEIKKILKSTKSGCSSDDIYIPKVRWFKLMDSFLRPHLKRIETQSNLGHFNRKKCKARNSVSKNEEPLSPEDMVSQQVLDDEQPTTSKQWQLPSELSKRKFQPATPTPFRKRKEYLTPVGNDVKSAIEKLDISKRDANVSVPKEDYFDHFGRYIASLLRSLPKERSSQLQASIVSMILEQPSCHIPSRKHSRYSISSNNSINSQDVPPSIETTSTEHSVFSLENVQEHVDSDLAAEMNNY